MAHSAVSTPVFTIIIAVRNAVRSIQQCLDSVVSQTFKHWEMIVVDGESTDGTQKIVLQNQRYIAWYVSEPDNGIYDAWNKGVARARGQWLLFLGADDFLWNDRVLEAVYDQLGDLSKDVSIVYGKAIFLNERSEIAYIEGLPWNDIRGCFPHRMSIPHSATFHGRNLFEGQRCFDSSFRIAGDYEFLLRNLKRNDAVFLENVLVVGKRIGGISSDWCNAVQSLKEARLAQRKNGIDAHVSWVLMMGIAYGWHILHYVFGHRVVDALVNGFRKRIFRRISPMSWRPK